MTYSDVVTIVCDFAGLYLFFQCMSGNNCFKEQSGSNFIYCALGALVMGISIVVFVCAHGTVLGDVPWLTK